MKFLLIAPFRTKINLKTALIAANRTLIAQNLKEISQSLSGLLPEAVQIATPRIFHDQTALKYATLSEDNLPDFASPVMCLKLAPITAPYPAQENNQSTATHPQVTMHDCTLELYDNTIGIFRATVVLGADPADYTPVCGELDEILTKACADVLRNLSPTLAQVENAMLAHAQTNASSIFLPTEKYEIFFDRHGTQNTETWFQPLWVTRVLLGCNDVTDEKFLSEWVQTDSSTATPIKLPNSEINVFIGNSFVNGNLCDAELTSLSNSLSFCTYFYTLYDAISSNLSRLLRKSNNVEVNKLKFQNRMSRIRGHIQYIELEFHDVMLGLQGHRKIISKQLLHVWEYENLSRAVKMKNAVLAEQIENFARQRQVRNARFIEMFLAAIGGVALFDFSVNLYSFVHDSSFQPDAITGLTDWPLVASIDTTMYLLIVFLAILLFKIIRNR